MAGTQFDSTDGFSVNGTTVVNASGAIVGTVSSSNVVNSFNGSTGAVTYAPPLATSSVTGVASFGNEFVVSAAGAVSLTSNYVTSVNSITGPVTIAQGSNVTVSTVGSTITISSSAGGGGSSPLATTTGVTGVASFNPNHFSVSATGTVSITGSYQTSLSRPFLFSGM
jgi:hypothetical protein